MTRGASRQARDIGTAMLFLLPSLALFVAFVFYPLGKTIYLSPFFTSPQGNPRVFAGLDQYLEFFTSPVFHAGLVATLWFVMLSVPAGIARAAAGDAREPGVSAGSTSSAP